MKDLILNVKKITSGAYLDEIVRIAHREELEMDEIALKEGFMPKKGTDIQIIENDDGLKVEITKRIEGHNSSFDFDAAGTLIGNNRKAATDIEESIKTILYTDIDESFQDIFSGLLMDKITEILSSDVLTCDWFLIKQEILFGDVPAALDNNIEYLENFLNIQLRNNKKRNLVTLSTRRLAQSIEILCVLKTF